MICLDDRTGAIELLPHLKPFGLPVEVCRLDIADLRWVGNGPEGDVDVGVERKRITDLVACIRDKRLSGFQLIGTDDHPGLLETFDYVYLLVEGLWRPGPHGILEHWAKTPESNFREWGWTTLYIGSSPMLYLEVDSFLASMELRAVTKTGEPVRVKRASTLAESGAVMATLYRNWTHKKWSEHGAHFDIYTTVPVSRGKKVGFSKPKINLVVKTAAQLDQVHKKAFDIGKAFKTVLEMVTASEGKWAQIDGIGRKMAKRIRADLGHTS